MRGFAEICLGILSLLNLSWARSISSDDKVFIQEKSADSFLSRSLLANNWDFELVVPGDLQRECFDEICSYEEAREVFEDDQKTDAFWKTYTNSQASSSKRLDLPALVSGILAAVIVAIIATVLGCYFCKRGRSKTTRRGGSAPVQMAGDERPVAEMVPLSGIVAPGLPSYNEALTRSGQYDAPPPPYIGETPSAPPETQGE